MSKHASKKYRLIEVNEPNLFEDVFPHTEVPLIGFDQRVAEEIDGRKVQVDFGSVKDREIVITDTTFRDGQQARPPYSVEQIVDIFELLSKLSGPNGVIRQTEFFLYTKNAREALNRCRELGHRYPEITSWIRADKGDFRLVK